ncbi:hypothetical protein RN001_008236 [Aquatica leii]|uniref:C-type lectin domain-containing protein n=1 Tax=Aquatica leii TaxID=1421715 RepID=A0AAN7P3Z8_9COLE|nr:hypothetical protein RN001_008236 [Aquatica leii]
MDSNFVFFVAVVATTLITVSSRAVNISNTWMLPEEGFPVFYRYFRDRISWYEADAVCQFHHANLVTVDTTLEFDAVRAYLKELDIINNVWIGLSKNNDKTRFMWTDFRPLTNDGHWQEAIPIGSNPLCAATDPAADFRWHALPCGGPEVASFICELPVPTWAIGSRGCLLTELPSLTVLYIPEQSALELTSDCGLDGTKRIACKGNANRDEMMKQLSCGISNDDFDDKTTKGSIPASTLAEITNLSSSSLNTKTTKPWIWTSNTIDTGDYGTATRHRRETENTVSPISPTKSTTDLTMRAKLHTDSEIAIKPLSSRKPNKVSVTSATVNTINDVTLDSSVTQIDIKYLENTATSVHELTTQESGSQPEEQAEAFLLTTTVQPKAVEVGQDEYPAVINQGQLFSIIENGTMFDVIELNDTGTEESYNKEASISKQHKNTTNKILTTALPHTLKNLYTTVIYHKEPPEDLTNKKMQQNKEKQTKQEVTPTFKMHESKTTFNDKHKQKTVNDLNLDNEKDLTKEVEMFQIIPDTSIKLNRTYRKKLPLIENNFTKEDALIKTDEIASTEQENSLSNTDDLVIADKNALHKVVEIKLHKEGNKNSTHSKLFITTRIPDKNKKINKIETNVTEKLSNLSHTFNNANDKIELEQIDPNIDVLNTLNHTAARNNQSEDVLPENTPRMSANNPQKESTTNESFSTNNDLVFEQSQALLSTVGSNAGESVEPVPQPRPNRQRSLTKPQRRSFYPYFFSRVLG